MQLRNWLPALFAVAFLAGFTVEAFSATDAEIAPIVAATKADPLLVVTIHPRTDGLKPSSEKYLTQEVHSLELFQALAHAGVDPARIKLVPVAAVGKDTGPEIETAAGQTALVTKKVTASSRTAAGSDDYTVNFDSASAVPIQKNPQDLDAFLRSVGQPGHDALVIEGYTDSTGKASYNKKLSELRALNVYELLVRAGLPPYRIDTRGMGTAKQVGKAESEADKAAARRVVVRWTKDQTIAAAAAVEDAKVAPHEAPTATPTPPPTPAAAVATTKVPAAPMAEPKLEKDYSSILDIVPFAGVLVPEGDFKPHAKNAATYGLGIGKALWNGPAGEFRVTLFGTGKSKFEAKEADRNGPVHMQIFDLRADYAYGDSFARPFIGVGVGSYRWDGTIVQPSSQLQNTDTKTDTGVLATLGLDLMLQQHFILAPELTYTKIGGEFAASLFSGTITLRCRI